MRGFESQWGATDIRAINPYAAYSLTDNNWTVHPRDQRLDWDPNKAYPKSWFEAIDRYADVVHGLVGRFHTAKNDVASQWDGARLTPRGITAASQLHIIAQDAHMLWNDLHESRKLAFSPEGKGYDDFYSVRWQQSKQDGWAQPLKEIAGLYGRASQDSLDDSQTVLRLAVHAVNSHG